jgi:Phosphotransferase enzyme family
MDKSFVGLSDPAIPTLAKVLNEAELVRQLETFGSLRGRWNLSQGVHVTVLKWKKASRCTLELVLNNASGVREELIGKVFAEERSDIYQTMVELQQNGFGPEEEFGIPCPIAFIPPLHLLLYEKAPGLRARTLIVGTNETDRLSTVEHCARWLARFQTQAPREGPLFDTRVYLSRVDQWSQDPHNSGLPFARKARDLAERLRVTAEHLESREMCAGHGTFTCGQVLLTTGRTVTIDWDTFNLTDPEHDVARFLVDLQRTALKHFGSLHACDQAAERFLKTYTAAVGSCDAASLTFYRAAIYMERATSDVKKQNPGWRSRAEMMLDEGLDVFHGVEGKRPAL